MTEQNSPENPAFTVEAVLTGVQPKFGKAESYGQPKPNVLVLTAEINLPAPTPPNSFQKWADEYGYRRAEEAGGPLRRQLTDELQKWYAKAAKEAEKLPKLRKPRHYFEAITAIDDPNVINHCKVCAIAEPDGETCIDGDATLAAQLKDLQAETDRMREEANGKLLQGYNEYVDRATAKMNRAFAASLGTGLFVAMMGQQIVLTFQPSNDVFQPMLAGVRAAQASIPTSTITIGGPWPREEMIALPGGSEAARQQATESDDEEDEDE